MVSKGALHVDRYDGTSISNSFLSSRLSSWQAHLMRISCYLKHGKGIWWKQIENGVKFLDGDNDPDYKPEGPQLHHFRSNDVYRHASQDWSTILLNTILPTPSIRLYDAIGNYQSTITFADESHHATSLENMTYSPPPLRIQSNSGTEMHIFSNKVPMCDGTPNQSTGISDGHIMENLPQQCSATPDLHEGSTSFTSMNTTSVCTSRNAQTTPSNTPSRSHSAVPTTMFQNVTCTSSENIQCTMECSDTEDTNVPETFQTKAAKLIVAITGNNVDLKRFDQLRQKLKDGMKEKGRKPTTSEKEEYKTLLAKLESSLLSIKYNTKDELQAIEKQLTANRKELYSSNTTTMP